MRVLKFLALILTLILLFSGCTTIENVENSSYFASSAVSGQDILGTVSAKTIPLPCDNYYCEGKKYTDVVALLEKVGFTNVHAIAQQGDSAKETRVNGSVIAVLVNDNIIFSQGEIFNCDIEIKVYYVVSSISEKIETTNSQTDSSEVSAIAPITIPEKQQSDSSKTGLGDNSAPEGITSGEITDITDDIFDSVWISEDGKKYHNKPNCSGMKTPKKISKKKAEDRGYQPCKRCYK